MWMAVLLAVALQSGAPSATSPAKVPRVAVELIADRTRVVPGESLSLGVRFVVPPGFHIGWSNPGTNGLATECALSAPSGFEIEGPIEPGPDRFQLAEDQVAFGWTGEVVVLYRVRAPKELARDSKVEFAVKASWFACSEMCFPGEAQKKLALEVAGETRASEPANAKLFEAALKRVPKPWSEAQGASFEWNYDKQHGANLLFLRVPGAGRIEFFPDADDGGLKLVNAALNLQREVSTLLLTLADDSKKIVAERSLRGVLRVERGRESTWYALDLRRPKPKTER